MRVGLWKDSWVLFLGCIILNLDVAGGTGYTAFHVSDGIGSVSHNAMHDSFAETEGQTQIFICDINPKMLNIGKKSATLDVRYTENNYLHWVEGNAKALSFEDGSMDGYTIEFGIRNVTHIEKALAKAYRRGADGDELGHRDGVTGVGAEARVGSSVALARVSPTLSRAAAAHSGGEGAAKNWGTPVGGRRRHTEEKRRKGGS
ncbi:hypothetical protein ZIOFF_016162 [Zingiber officinale]|uniref:Uncharacterized protein n=1 Tax=Zingiber officinale TaxID=94328 RepID=A0A8J5LQR9_ZINOF|nr:hypothetical protein ZIOFF_016162 [Zingiber officinale]